MTRRPRGLGYRTLLTALLAAVVGGCSDGNIGSDRRQQMQQNSGISDNSQLNVPRSANGDQAGGRQEAGPPMPVIRDLVVRDQFAYVLVPDALVVVALDEPEAPKIVARQVLARSPRRIALDGVHAYIACGPGGLQVVSIARPRQPQVVGAYVPDSGTVTTVAVENGVAVAGLPGVGLAVLDVKDPHQPQEQKLVAKLGEIRDLALHAGRAYAVAGKLQILDVAKPAEARLIGSYEIKEVFEAVAWHYDYTLLATAEAVAMLNLGVPERPLRVARLTAEEIAKVVESAEDSPTVTVTATAATPPPDETPPAPAVTTTTEPAKPAATGSDPAKPDEAGQVSAAPGAAKPDGAAAASEPAPQAPAPALDPRLVVADGRVFLSRGDDGLWMLAIEDQKKLTAVARFTGVDAAAAVGAEGKLVVVGLADGEVLVFRLDAEGKPQRVSGLKIEVETTPASVPATTPTMSPQASAAITATPEPTTARPVGAPKP